MAISTMKSRTVRTTHDSSFDSFGLADPLITIRRPKNMKCRRTPDLPQIPWQSDPSFHQLAESHFAFAEDHCVHFGVLTQDSFGVECCMLATPDTIRRICGVT